MQSFGLEVAMYTVAEVMTRSPIFLDESDDLVLAEAMFHFGLLRHLPVVRDGKVVGLVTQSDFLKSARARDPSDPARLTAGDVMTKRVEVATPRTSLGAALSLMSKHKLSCLPIVDAQQRLVGIITERDATDFAGRMLRDLERVEPRMSNLLGRVEN
jgi:CBS domain-containing membrane protein